jgi:RNA polymerase sigma-70 factor (ECF subfamily)
LSERDVGQAEALAPASRTPSASVPASSSEPSDEELEALWKQGSAPAFATLFERWHRRAYAFAFRRTNGDVNLSEDVAQRAFVNLYAKPPPGSGRASFKTLLFTVVENEIRTEARKRGRRKEQAIDVTLETRPAKASGAPADGLEEQDEKRRVAAALEELTEEERSLVLLREVEGMTFREVCEETGLTRDMVRGRLGKALARLKRALTRSSPQERREKS